MEIKKVKLELIKPSPMNPRKTFDEDALEELADSIDKQGLIEAITVRPKGETRIIKPEEQKVEIVNLYEIVCGERRYRAYCLLASRDLAKYAEIPCVIREMADKEAFEAMITENLQRKDVDPIEEALAFAQLAENGYSIADIAVKLGKTQRFVVDRIKLNGLIPELKRRVREGDIPIAGAMMLAKLEEEGQQYFAENYRGRFDTNNIKNYIDNQFMILNSSIWREEDWSDDDIPMCAECVNNTANHGCLFYEMKSDSGKCTKRKCFNSKTALTIVRKIKAMDAVMVKTGEYLNFGKTVVIADAPCSYWSNDKKELFKEIADKIKDEGYQIVNPNDVFKGRCWYDADDERTENFIANNDVYRCIRFFDYGNPVFREEFYYIKKEIATSDKAVADSSEIDKEKVRAKINSTLKKFYEHKYEATTNMLKASKYGSREDEITDIEQLALDVLILSSLSYTYKSTHDIGLKDEIKYVKEHPEDRHKWYRQYILEKVTTSYSHSNNVSEELLRLISEELYPKELQDAISPIKKKYDAKIQSLKEQIGEE